MKTKLLVFDWDGTLIDSVERIVYCINKTIDALKLQPLDEQSIRSVIGLGLQEAISTLFPQVKDKPELIDQVVSTYRQFFFSDKVPQAHLFPQVHETLDWLKQKQYPMAIATGKGYQGVMHELQQHDLLDFFSWIKTADKTKSKPDPMMLQHIMQESGFSEENMLMIGDTVFDLEMAYKINVPSIGVSYGVHSKEQLLKWQPLHIIEQFSQLTSILGE